MIQFLTAMMPLSAGMLGKLDVDGFLVSDTFLGALAQFFSTIILQVLNVLLYGGSATL